ncbi:MAG: undecaprenyl/decaprenyl-phosphate alpha-N-acetylglucosaminyl 1-phosphate transferase [Bdellovibrio sp.]|nr:undecaprenyl/decaprenyl-phosphate alpha-N-acetylglucosaminyl 1-phosphate transferase [Bdellovibrio sp.]
MWKTLAEIAFGTVLVGIPIQLLNLKLARRFQWVDIPSARKRHRESVPITGGVAVISTWAISVGGFCLLNPAWASENQQALITLAVGCGVLVILGLVDDLRGLSPGWKLAVEFLLAVGVLTQIPEVTEICSIWSHKIGLIVWPLAIIWIVGITNTINLIDGLDGLAGGTSLLVLTGIGFLCLLVKTQAILPIVLTGLLVPSVAVFLALNWSPARIFLGDNGSLPLGFVISVTSLMCRPHMNSWIMIASMVLMLGYPIVDTGLAVFRRYSKGQPLFKADRYHLHYRIQRLGLTTRQTALLLLSLSLYLQFTGICVNFLQPWQAGLVIAISMGSVISLLQLVFSIEQRRVVRLFHQLQNDPEYKNSENVASTRTVIHLEIGVLLETASEDSALPYLQVMRALELLLKTMIRREDAIILNDQKLSIILEGKLSPHGEVSALVTRLKAKLEAFLTLYGIQGSLASIPIKVEQLVYVKPQDTSNPRVKKVA